MVVNDLLHDQALLEHAWKIGRSKMLENAWKFWLVNIPKLRIVKGGAIISM